ncbi:MAG: PA14 domain-containing protein, partial [Candidatus Sumerlaeia bacterium]|nr:PA14 domain-containing protein [Candidatus Sumerlaeia bacterium]
YDPQRGLFYYNPLLLAMIPGIIMMLRQKHLLKEFFLIIAIIVFHFLFNAAAGQSIMFWGGGGSAGPRHLHSMIPFAMIPVALFFHKVKPLFLIFFIPSFLIMLLTTAVQPVLGFEKNPLLDFVLPSYLKNQLAIHPYGIFNNTLITQKSVAFNLGMLLGFKGSFSLLPLLGIWLVFLWFILADFVKVQLLPKCYRYLIIMGTYLFLLPIFAYPELSAKNQEKITIRPNYFGLIGYYYPNDKWQGNPSFIRYEKVINFSWKWGNLPLPLPFSIEWKGYLIAPLNATYTIAVESNGDVWLYIDENLFINKSGDKDEPQLTTVQCTLNQGWHPLILRYINRGQNGTIKLYWQSGTQLEIIPSGYFIAR